MAEQRPTLQVDNDWKKQAQEEKRRLVEEESRRQPSTPPAGGGADAPVSPSLSGTSSGATPGAGTAASPQPGASQRREVPTASFPALVQSIVTQVLFYLGDLAPRGQQPVVDLDMAKHNIDLLGMLEEKTRGNLTPEEQSLLDTTLYEVRMRYVTVASQYVM